MFKTAVIAATAALANAWGEHGHGSHGIASQGYGSHGKGYGGYQKGYETKKSYNYSFAMPAYKQGRVLSKPRHVGPYSYRRPRVHYRVAKPAPRLDVDGPHPHLGLAKPVFGAITRAGDIRQRTAHVANRYRRPNIAARRPQFAFQQPQMNFNSGVGQTAGARFGYQSPVIEQEIVAPQYDMGRMNFARKIAAPATGFDVAGPRSNNSVAGPQTAKAFSAPRGHINPAITRYGYQKPHIGYQSKRVYSAPEYFHKPQHVKVAASPMKSHGW